MGFVFKPSYEKTILQLAIPNDQEWHMEVHLVAEALKFMLLGMGVVFVFLLLLVQVMRWQQAIVAKYIKPKPKPTPVYVPQQDDESARVAAIIAAVTEYRKHQQQIQKG